jgi:hypothetical protein
MTGATPAIAYATPVTAQPVPVQAVAQSPLSPEHLQQMQDARLRAKKVRRCIAVANFDGWSVGIFGALTLLFGMFSVVGWVLGGGMLAVAHIELSTIPALKRLESRALRRLGWNQLALGSLLLGYAGWSLYAAMFGPDPLASTIAQAPEAAEMLAPYSGMARMISAAIYICLAGIAIFAQGGTALYYFSREKYIRAYREQTPAWIVEFQQGGGQL